MIVGSLRAVWRRHAVVAALTLSLMAILVTLTGLTPERWVDIDVAKADSWSWRLSVATADTSLVLLVVALAIGPLHVLRGGRPATHRPLRRIVGLWAGVLALIHVAFALFIHTNGWAIWRNWFVATPSWADPLPLLRNKRGLANWVGLAQVALVVLLLAISRNVVLRRMGARRWKRLQRSSYVLIALVAIHVVLYQIVEQRLDRHRVPVLSLLGLVALLQLAAAATVQRRFPANTPSRTRCIELSDEPTDRA